ncbi:MAG: MBL fold metallo-hydrolase [Leptospirales bacterium]|nr:MBL fold metallo-hydrolase [Leptospirales bacterium]
MTRSRKAIIVIVAILSVLWIGKIALFDRSPVPEKSDFTLNLKTIRALARESKGSLPESLHALVVGEGAFPASAVIAGEGLTRKVPLVFASFQVVYPEKKTVIIDTAFSQKAHKDMASDAPYYVERFDAMQEAMLKASQILLTHEHPDHIGGIAISPNVERLKEKLLLTAEQVNDPYRDVTTFTPEALKVIKSLKPLEFDLYFSPSPGIVLIKTPSHSPGTQFIYIALNNGNEYLLVGDIVWSMENIRKLKGKAALLNLLFLQENRALVASQIRMLYNLMNDPANKIQIVPAHDADRFKELFASKAMIEGFL